MSDQQQPLVSIIITTRNSELTISSLLTSINEQLYRNIEVIVVDNSTNTQTSKIAVSFGAQILRFGPERSAQRNHGVGRATGKYVLILDADMELTPSVISDCVDCGAHGGNVGVIIPEVSFGAGFWAACKALERSCYIGDDTIEAARFFERSAFLDLGGYDVEMTGPEDWDFSQRFRAAHNVVRARAFIKHNEGRLSLLGTARKKYYYGVSFRQYRSRHPRTAARHANAVFRPAFLRSWRRLIRDPLHLCGMFVMKLVETAAAAAGVVASFRSDPPGQASLLLKEK
jgi:glycosyltransferase involved in cell wall biosynthesis